MTEYCPNKNYTYISTSNFGDKKKVTEELLRAFCGNDAYLKRKIEELEDLTDPETTKRFNPPYYIDEAKSFGVVQGTKDRKPVFKFNNNVSKNKIIDFDADNDNGDLYDDSLIDYNSSDVEIYNDGTTCGARIKLEKDTIITPTKTKTINQSTIANGKEVRDAYCHGPYGGLLNSNGHWYVGFNVNKNYNIKDSWKKNPLSYSIPAVARAMTFKAGKTGLLTKVNLGLSADKTTVGKIYVEIRTVNSKGKPTTKVLARATAKFKGKGQASNMIKTFVFDNAVKVTAGVKYALVVRSSLGKYSQTYHLVGWRKECYTDWKDAQGYGEPFGSYDNGKTWHNYNSASSKALRLSYKDTPRAFGFEVYIKKTRLITTVSEKTQYQETDYTYYPKGNHPLYLKVPVDNPIYNLTVSASTTTPTGTSVKFYVSRDNRNWLQNGTSSGEGLYDATTCPDIFDTTSKPTFLFIKADLYTNNITETPVVEDVTLTMSLGEAYKAYLRTLYYRPDKDIMLPACIWSEVNANYENEYSTVGVDLIRDMEQEELISLKTATVSNLQQIILDYDSEITTSDVNTDAKVKTYCTGNTDFLNYLKTLEPSPIYILGNDDNDEPFFNQIELFDYPAYPLLEVQSQVGDITESDGTTDSWSYANSQATYNLPINLGNQLLEVNLTRQTENTTETIVLYEGTLGNKVDEDNSRYADFNYDKTNNRLIFDLDNSTLFKSYATISNDKIVSFKDPADASKIYDLKICALNTAYTEWLDYTVDYNNKSISWESNGLKLVEGELKVIYNPIFIRNLQETDFPLKLDLWAEVINVSSSITSYELRSYPVDSLRMVAINYNTENEVILKENIDFTVDYQKKIIYFTDTITAGNTVTIKYTPALTDNGLALGFRMDRTSNEQDCYIFDNSFTTRT